MSLIKFRFDKKATRIWQNFLLILISNVNFNNCYPNLPISYLFMKNKIRQTFINALLYKSNWDIIQWLYLLYPFPFLIADFWNSFHLALSLLSPQSLSELSTPLAMPLSSLLPSLMRLELSTSPWELFL